MTTTIHTSEPYREAVRVIVAAEAAFWAASLREAVRLMPDTVAALILRVNDTPRLAFDSYLDALGKEHDAEDIDDQLRAPGLFDAIDEVAMQLGVGDPEEAAAWLLSHDDEGRFVLRREDVSPSP